MRISDWSSDVCSSDLLTLDLSKANSLAEAQAMIAAYAQANPGRRWIIGAGWNQERWGMNRFPTAADIDAILPDTAVWLERADGHAGWANSRAMTMAGNHATNKNTEGGRIEKKGGEHNATCGGGAQSPVEQRK